MDLKKITGQVCELSLKTADFLRDEVTRLKAADIEVKGLNNFVTYVDKSSEARLMEGLAKILPGTGFIAEESPGLETQRLTWIIDPLDGTTNFIHAVPVYSISIALMEDDEIILGVITEINRKECFYTWKDAPSYLNGSRIRVTDTEQMKDCLFATGFPYYDYGLLDPYLNLFRFMMKSCHGVRRLGSAAADLAYVACGRFDGFYEYGLSPWDVAAGSLLVRNAGGKVTDFSGGKNFLYGREIITTNARVFDEFFARFTENFV